jgi:hypothetical protein
MTPSESVCSWRLLHVKKEEQMENLNNKIEITVVDFVELIKQRTLGEMLARAIVSDKYASEDVKRISNMILGGEYSESVSD